MNSSQVMAKNYIREAYKNEHSRQKINGHIEWHRQVMAFLDQFSP